jgi:hypothetical protein
MQKQVPSRAGSVTTSGGSSRAGTRTSGKIKLDLKLKRQSKVYISEKGWIATARS